MYAFPWSIPPRPQQVLGPTAADVRQATHDATQPLEARLAVLERACAAMWMLLQERTDLTDDDLLAAIHKVDEEASDPALCPHCKRRLLSRQSARCNWCSGEIVVNPLTGP